MRGAACLVTELLTVWWTALGLTYFLLAGFAPELLAYTALAAAFLPWRRRVKKLGAC